MAFKRTAILCVTLSFLVSALYFQLPDDELTDSMEWREIGGTDTTTEEIDDSDAEPRHRIFKHCDLTKGDVMERYVSAVKNLSKQIDEFIRAGI